MYRKEQIEHLVAGIRLLRRTIGTDAFHPTLRNLWRDADVADLAVADPPTVLQGLQRRHRVKADDEEPTKPRVRPPKKQAACIKPGGYAEEILSRLGNE